MRLIVTFVAVLMGCGCQHGPNLVTHLSDSIEPLRHEFNVDRGKPRYVALFSPT
jgi:hypothetical protein